MAEVWVEMAAEEQPPNTCCESEEKENGRRAKGEIYPSYGLFELIGPAQIGEFLQNQGHLVSVLNGNDIQVWSCESRDLVFSL